MKNVTFFVVVAWIIFATGIIDGSEKGKMDRKVSLPTEVEGWKWDGKRIEYNSRTLFEYIDGAAELYLAYGFKSLTARRFEKSGQPPITIEVYEMSSSEDAYGMFSFEHQDESAGIGQGSEFGGGLLRFWKGNYFVSIYADGDGGEVERAILNFGRATAGSIQATGPEPRLLGFIPGKDIGLVDKSLRYIRSHVLLNQRFFVAHQNILNLNPRTEAALAQYVQDKQKIQFLLIRYPNLKEAGNAYQSFMKAYLPDAGGKDHSRTEDRKWTFARQRNEFVLIVFGAPMEVDAEGLLKAAEEKLERSLR